ncbi:UNVERIFIED_CONTAM: hypothetical protein NCL1_14907 [Trichonephila clavipes]
MTMVKDSCRCVLSSSSSTTEDPPCRGANAQLICRDSRTSYCWKFGEMSASSDVVFVTSLEFKTMGVDLAVALQLIFAHLIEAELSS